MRSKVRRSKLVLAIDDDPIMLQLHKRIFEGQGYDVALAADGVYGMTLLKETKPALVLLDILMPGPDGYQVLQSIRQTSDVPVIMVSVEREVDTVQKALDLGADDFVRKPFGPLELVARVQAKLRRAGPEVTMFRKEGKSYDLQ